MTRYRYLSWCQCHRREIVKRCDGGGLEWLFSVESGSYLTVKSYLKRIKRMLYAQLCLSTRVLTEGLPIFILMWCLILEP